MRPTPGQVGTMLRSIRERTGLTQEGLAERASVSARTIRNLEAGVGRPRSNTVLLLADALELGTDQKRRLLAMARRFASPEHEPSAPAPNEDPDSPPEAQVTTRTAAAAGEAPEQLPLDVYGFTGRSHELDRLDSMLDEAGDGSTAAAVFIVAGTAGVGKTALAIHWAHQVAGWFPDGQLYVNLRGFDPSGSVMSPAEAVRGFLDALGVPPQRVPASAEAQAALYRSLLAGRPMLIILDNARDAEQVRPLLPGSPDAVILVTSRDQLTSLVAAEGARLLTLELLTAADARELLSSRLGHTRLEAEQGAVEEIICRSAGLPLALAVVAARAVTYPAFPLGTLADELRQARGSLDAFASDDVHTDVRAVFSWSYNMLSPAAASMFRLLGLHPGPDITLAAAASLAALPVSGARPLLAELTRAHLVTQHSPGRYAFHDLLRAWASELALTHDRGDARESALHRALDHYLRTACRADRVLHPLRPAIGLAQPQQGVTPEDIRDHAGAIAWFTAERQVLLAAIRYAASAGFDTHTWQLAWAMTTFLHWRGHWQDAADTQGAALDAARRLGDGPAQGQAHRVAARACAWLGRHDEAHAHLQQAIEQFAAAGEQVNLAYTHLNVGIVYEYQGLREQALSCSLRALDLFTEAGHDPGRATALNAIGWVHAMLGNHDQSLVYSEQCLTLFQALGHHHGMANALDNLGYAHHHLGHHDRAISLCQQAIALFGETGSRYDKAASLKHLGDAYQALRDRESARHAWRQALAILDELDHPDAGEVRSRLGGAG